MPAYRNNTGRNDYHDYGNRRSFQIDPEPADDSSGRRDSRHTGIIVVFVFVFLVVIGAAVWLFLFSDRGMRIFDDDSHVQLAAPASREVPMSFVGLAFKDVTLRMDVGERRMIRPVLQVPPDSKNVNTHALTLKWNSENPSVVTVDQHGMLVAKGIGSARVAVNIVDDCVDSNTAYCLVQVGNTAYAPEPARDNRAQTPSDADENADQPVLVSDTHDNTSPTAEPTKVVQKTPSDSAEIFNKVRNALQK